MGLKFPETHSLHEFADDETGGRDFENSEVCVHTLNYAAGSQWVRAAFAEF
jgi:hypothetical protein